ncbi:MAG: DUF4013 domain-containing protein [Thermofilaceae archaeon]
MSQTNINEITSESWNFTIKLLRDVGNLILLIVLNVIPVVDFIVLGYFKRIVRFDLKDPPKLDDFGGLFIEGFKLVIASLIYAFIPLIILIIGFAGMFFGGFFGRFVGLTFIIIGGLLAVAILFIGLPALAIYMRTDDFSKVFAFGEAWNLIQAFGLGNYIILYIVLIVFGLITSAIGSVIPWVGPAILGVFSGAFSFKAISLFVNRKYPVRLPPPPPPPTF